MSEASATETDRRSPLQSGNRGRLDHGRFFEGTVVDYNPLSQLCRVRVPGDEVIDNVVLTLPLVGGLTGFKVSCRPAVGTRVIVAYGNPSYIITSIPSDVPDGESWFSRTMTDSGLRGAQSDAHPDPSNTVPSHNSPEDLYDGEVEMGHLTGGFLRFLLFMSSLGCGERAKIEFHLLRDLTRIVSHNYEHFSSSGDFKIFEDGRNNLEFHGTSYGHERWGAAAAEGRRTELPTTGAPDTPVDPLETGRWRYSFLLGFLGDLFNGWFSDPVAAAGRMVPDAVRGGRARFHVGQDGSILAASCAEIVLEKVVRVQVPIRIKHEEDPKGVLRAEMDQLDNTYLKGWDFGGEAGEHHTLFKVREYVRYFNQYHSLARLHQLADVQGAKAEWKIPSEEDTPAPDPGSGEKDRGEANTGGLAYWKDAYATIRILRDGSILTMDAYGNATASGPYGVQISSARHIHQYAAGDIVRVAGGSIFDSAHHHIEQVAHRGSMIQKSRTGHRVLCERGTLWLKSDHNPDAPYTPADGDPEAEVIGDQGIRVQAAGGESRIVSKKKLRVEVETDDPLELVSKGDVKLAATYDLTLMTENNLVFHAGFDVQASYNTWTSETSGGFILNGIASFKRGQSKIDFLLGRNIQASNQLAGPERGPRPVKDDASKCCLRDHHNHVDTYKSEIPFALDDSEVTVPEAPEADPAASWKLLPEDSYRWTDSGGLGAKADVDKLFEPLAQQHLRLDSPEGYGDWPGMADALLSGSGTASGTSWPAKGAKWLAHQNPSGPKLQVPCAAAAASFSASTQTALTSVSVNFKVLKR